MFGMVEEFAHDSLLWDDDQSWAFPILAADGDENGGNILIEDGKILTEIVNLDGQTAKADNEAPPPPPPPTAVKRKKQGQSHMQGTSSGSNTGKKRSGGAAADGSGSGDKGDEGIGGGESDEHEQHIWTERERRKKMRDMFINLHALIPNIHPRADKASVVDEAILYIKRLRQTLDSLEKLKKENLRGDNANPTGGDASLVTPPAQSREAFLAEQGSAAVTLESPSPALSGPEFPAVFKTWTSPNVILSVCGRDAHINVCCPKKPGLLTAILFVMERYKLEVVSAQVSSGRCTRMYMIHARANGGAHQFPEASFLVEEMYKQAAAEIMLWLNS